MRPRIHIIGAGMAGLAAAVRLRHLGADIIVYESAPRAGGRCRSYHDPQLDCVIDNGNHLLLSGNEAAMSFLDEIGARDRLAGPDSAAFPFVDVSTGLRWCIEPSAGLMPWWIFRSSRRVPGTGLSDYFSVLRVLNASDTSTMSACVSTKSPMYRNFWEPLTVAAINTAPHTASAALMRPVLEQTFLKGAKACRPLVARVSLADTLIDPAVDTLKAAGIDVLFGTRVEGLTLTEGAVSSLALDGADIPVQSSDTVILATPPWVAQSLLPTLTAPPAGGPIVNVHYRLAQPVTPDGTVRIIGVVGGLAQWVFVRNHQGVELASVTISAAADVVDLSADEISRRCWRDVTIALNLGDMAEPLSRVVKERRATFAQTPETQRLRPSPVTDVPNLLLAGDWTATGLPATIEGALRSGFRAAALAARRITPSAVIAA